MPPCQGGCRGFESHPPLFFPLTNKCQAAQADSFITIASADNVFLGGDTHMKIKDFLCQQAVTADLKSQDKKGVINDMVDLLIKAGVIDKKSKTKIVETLMAREALGSTAIGQGIAIPHGKCDNVDQLTAALGISKSGIDFDSLDGDPVYIFFLLIAPIDSAGPHLKALARISRLLKDKFFRDNLKSAGDDKALLQLIQQEDARAS